MTDIQTTGDLAGILPFIYGHVDPTLFPVEQLHEACSMALAQDGPMALNYNPSLGSARLLGYLSDRFAHEEALELASGELMLTGGASAALDMVVRVFTRPGDTVLVEAPTYHEGLAVIRDYPVKLAAIPLDDKGLRVDRLAETLDRLTAAGERPALLYTIPTFQNPSGVTLSSVRRLRLLELAHQYNLLLVEDDVYRDLYFEQEPPASLYALDTDEVVIRLGSFSKILAPGLRLGWLMGSAGHVRQLVESGLSSSAGGANPLSASIAAAFCEQNWLEPHVELLRETYRHRRDVLLEALAAHMPAAVRWTRPAGGFFVWFTLPRSLPAWVVLQDAHEVGINFLTGEPFYATETAAARHQIRLPFSYIAPEDLARGAETLAGLITRRLVVK